MILVLAGGETEDQTCVYLNVEVLITLKAILVECHFQNHCMWANISTLLSRHGDLIFIARECIQRSEIDWSSVLKNLVASRPTNVIARAITKLSAVLEADAVSDF